MKQTFAELTAKQPLVPYIRFADYAIREAGWFLPHRKLLDYLFIYIQEGRCEMEIDGVSYTYGEGDFCLIQPNVSCSLLGVTHTITPYVHFDLFYNPRREQSFMTLPGQTNLGEYVHLQQPGLNDCMNIHIPVQFRASQRTVHKESLLKLIGLWQNSDVISRLEANQLLGEMMLELLKSYSDLSQDNHDHKPQSLNWIAAYLSYSLSQPLSLEDLARRARLSPSRFSAVFKEKFGMAPYQYLLTLRVQHAQKLIKTGEYTFEEIAQYCGFSDASHFNKMFKKIMGETPGSFRNHLDL